MEAEAVRMVDSHRRNSLDSLDGAAGDCRDNQAAAEGIREEGRFQAEYGGGCKGNS